MRVRFPPSALPASGRRPASRSITRVARRNPGGARVLAGRMDRPLLPRGTIGIAAVGLLLAVAGPVRRADAGVQIRITLGPPVYVPPYAYPTPAFYPYYPYPYYVAPPVAVCPAPPPPGFVPGHWETRYDPWGRPVSAWVPAHLR